MPASHIGKKWNDQWWKEVVRQRKTALPPIRNVRARRKKKTK